MVRNLKTVSGSDTSPIGMPLNISQHLRHSLREGRSAGLDGDGTRSCQAEKGCLDSIKLSRYTNDLIHGDGLIDLMRAKREASLSIKQSPYSPQKSYRYFHLSKTWAYSSTSHMIWSPACFNQKSTSSCGTTPQNTVGWDWNLSQRTAPQVAFPASNAPSV